MHSVYVKDLQNGHGIKILNHKEITFDWCTVIVFAQIDFYEA